MESSERECYLQIKLRVYLQNTLQSINRYSHPYFKMEHNINTSKIQRQKTGFHYERSLWTSVTLVCKFFISSLDEWPDYQSKTSRCRPVVMTTISFVPLLLTSRLDFIRDVQVFVQVTNAIYNPFANEQLCITGSDKVKTMAEIIVRKDH